MQKGRIGQYVQPKRIEWIDGWRSIAVALVILSHLAIVYEWEYHIFPGKLGVYIFFVISGYIVTRLLYVEFKSTGSIGIKRFFIRRVLRIAPPLVVYILFCILILNADPLGALRAMVFTCHINISLGDCGWIFGHTWSLGFEEQFYLILPFLLVAFFSCRFSFLLIPGFMLAALPFLWPIDFIGRVGFLQIYMLLGLGAAYALNERKLAPILARVPVSVGLGAGVFSWYWIFLPPSFEQKILAVFVPFSVALLVLSLPQVSSAVHRVLVSLPLRTLGLWSYSLYLWQQAALQKATWNTGLWPILYLGVAVAVSALSFYTIEAAARRVSRNYSH